MAPHISVHGFYQRTQLSCSPTKGIRSASGKVLHASGHKVGNVRKNTDILCREWRLLHKQSTRHHHRSYEVIEITTIRCVKSTSSGYNRALDIKASAVAIPPRSRKQAPGVLQKWSKNPAWARGIEASVSAIPPGTTTLLSLRQKWSHRTPSCRDE